MIPVRFVERVGGIVVDRGSTTMPAVPRVGETVRLPSRPDELAATVMGVEWLLEFDPFLRWVCEVWVATGDGGCG